MPISMTNAIMRQIIMDHYSHPNNKRLPNDINAYKTLHMHSDNCIDDIDVYLKIDNKIVVDACFEGRACAISTASTDIMCDLLIDKTLEQALYIIDEYIKMIHEQPFDESVLDEALAFINTSKQAARIRCATIGWNAANKIIEDDNK